MARGLLPDRAASSPCSENAVHHRAALDAGTAESETRLNPHPTSPWQGEAGSKAAGEGPVRVVNLRCVSMSRKALWFFARWMPS